MKKNILVVDDSALLRRVDCDIINSDEQLNVTDVCKDGLEALEKLRTTKYDAVILDVNMPKMDGLELLEHLKKEKIKANVIMCSTLTVKDAETTIKALELGAIDFVPKPSNIIEAKGPDFKENLLSTIKAVLRIKTFRTQVTQATRAAAKTANEHKGSGKNKLIAIASSTGGPRALQSVIPYIPADIDAPIVLVQHMPVGFTKSMAERLDELSKVKVKEAEEGDVLQKGCVYIAPGGKHMEIKKKASSHVVSLNEMPPIGGLRPCANITFDSIAGSDFDQIICVVLTGMGADGTNGILSLGKKKSIHVISQDEASCVVYGMPRAIYETGVVDEVVTLTDVAKTITKNVGVK